MMRSICLLGLLLFSGLVFAAGGTQALLHDRCVAAISTSGQPADVKALHETTIPLGESGFLFQFADAAGATFSCQICDDGNPANHACGSIGLELTWRPKEGELKRLPAEIDRKCVYFLQKEIKPREETAFIDQAIVKRVQVSADHTETRWLYKMELDGNAFRCVIRKSDGNFRVERQTGDDWRPIAAGVLF